MVDSISERSKQEWLKEMHRATPLNTAFRSYTAGGARTVIAEADDKKLMQESKGNFMKGETRQEVESPQNYGFTSVVMPADKDEQGNIKMGAEGFVSFMGGNRSFPVTTIMDDRRHRLKELEKGDTAIYRTKDDRQQFHMSEQGTFWSTRNDRINRIALVDPPQQQQQGQQGQTTGQQSGGQAGEDQQNLGATGQKAALDDNKSSKINIEQNGQETKCCHGDAISAQKTGSDSTVYYKDRAGNSAQATDDHTHIRNNKVAIWVSGGCFSDMPIVIKKDTLCKG
jgi:phage gp45-like